MKAITLIGCGIFQEEVEKITAEIDDLELIWLEVGLHDSIERLEEVLTAEAERVRAGGRPGVGLLYGLGCLPTMKDFAKNLNLPILGVKNCLAAMVGDDRLKELEQNRTLVGTPGWVRKMWLGRADTPLGWKADDYRINFGRYDLILILDSGLNPLADEEIINCFDLVQVPIEVRECGLDFLKGEIGKLIDKVRAAP